MVNIAVLHSGWHAFLVAIPFLSLALVGILRLDERWAGKRSAEALVFCPEEGRQWRIDRPSEPAKSAPEGSFQRNLQAEKVTIGTGGSRQASALFSLLH
jgi:hypothetical protein